jgi:hypothetical protein
VNVVGGRVAWGVADPTNGTFPPAFGAPYVAGSGSRNVLVVTSGNYGDGQGRAAVSAATGKTAWAAPWPSTCVSAMRYPTRQGWAFADVTSGASYESYPIFSLANGSVLDTGYIPAPLQGGYSFDAAVAVSASGACGYFTGEGASCDSCSADVFLVGWCAMGVPQEDGSDAAAGLRAGGAFNFTSQFAQRVDELCHPDYRQVAIGPGAGQLTVWHSRGIAVYAAGVPGAGVPYSQLCR